MTKRPTLRDKALAMRAFAPFELIGPLTGGVPSKLVGEPPWVAKAAAAKPRAKPRKLEQAIQKQICEYLAYKPNILWWHTPNSTYTGPMTGAKMGYHAKMKTLGVKRGVPDITCVFRGKNQGIGDVTVIFAELKAEKGSTTAEQKDWLGRANALGCYAAEVRSLDEFIELLAAAGY